MASKVKVNPFKMFEAPTKVANIEALDGAEVEYRELTMAEDDRFQKMMIKNIDNDGNPVINTDKYLDVKYEKVATALVNPKMTVAELKALPKSASGAISEILALINGGDEGDEDEGKGN